MENSHADLFGLETLLTQGLDRLGEQLVTTQELIYEIHDVAAAAQELRELDSIDLDAEGTYRALQSFREIMGNWVVHGRLGIGLPDDVVRRLQALLDERDNASDHKKNLAELRAWQRFQQLIPYGSFGDRTAAAEAILSTQPSHRSEPH
jgi:hypothetical protein